MNRTYEIRANSHGPVFCYSNYLVTIDPTFLTIQK